MEGSEDKQWVNYTLLTFFSRLYISKLDLQASKYLLDPLTAPEPSDETGPGTHHVANTGRASKSPKVSRKVVGSGSLRSSTDTSEKAHREKPRYPTPPDSSRSEKFPDFDAAYNPPSNRFSTTTASTQIPTSTGGVNSTTTGDNESTRPRRTSSLSQRYPGDTSHRPLDMLRKSDKAAHRSPHLRKQHHVGADTIDNLDTIAGTPYHHEGPYDAAMTARNRGAKNAPLAALAGSNAEALRATPREKVLDALEKHYPLDGTAVVPPGMVDREGRLFKYEEGTDMMRELNPGGGPYRRWAHVVSSFSFLLIYSHFLFSSGLMY